MTGAKTQSFYQMPIEIESKYSNCFSRNLCRMNKRTMIIFDKYSFKLLKQWMLMINSFCVQVCSVICRVKPVKLMLQIDFFLTFENFYTIFCCCLCFTETVLSIRSSKSSSEMIQNWELYLKAIVDLEGTIQSCTWYIVSTVAYSICNTEIVTRFLPAVI